MKRTPRKLSLHRDVLRVLSAPESLQVLHGAKTIQASPATHSCQYTACSCYGCV